MDDNKYVPSKRGLASQTQPKEILPARKSLRLQGIDADTGLKLPEKEPSAYFLYDTTEISRHELRDLKLSEFISAKDKDVEDVSNYLTRIAHSLKIKEEQSKNNYLNDNVSKSLQKLKVTVSLFYINRRISTVRQGSCYEIHINSVFKTFRKNRWQRLLQIEYFH